jgi:hypothetical protein
MPMIDKAYVPAIIGALSGAVVAAARWFVSHTLSTRRDESARRTEATRDFLGRQIEELYGPLLGLIQYSRMVFDIGTKKLPTDQQRHIDFARFTGRDDEIWRFFVEGYFLPVNAQIRNLIRAKMHLLDGAVLPDSFAQFFVHARRASRYCTGFGSSSGSGPMRFLAQGGPPTLTELRKTLCVSCSTITAYSVNNWEVLGICRTVSPNQAMERKSLDRSTALALWLHLRDGRRPQEIVSKETAHI